MQVGETYINSRWFQFGSGKMPDNVNAMMHVHSDTVNKQGCGLYTVAIQMGSIAVYMECCGKSEGMLFTWEESLGGGQVNSASIQVQLPLGFQQQMKELHLYMAWIPR